MIPSRSPGHRAGSGRGHGAAGAPVRVLLLCVLVWGIAGCGSGDTNTTTARSSPTTAKKSPAVVAAGCHQYCQQAGGYGGGDEGRPARDFVRIHTHGKVPLRGSSLPVTVTCVDQSPCRGAILLDPVLPSDVGVQLGRADLAVDSNRTATIAVPIDTVGRDAIRGRHGGLFPVYVLVDYGDPACPADSARPCVGARRVIIDGTSSG